MKKIFKNKNITEYAVIPFDEALVINPRLMPEEKINSIVVFLVPYKSTNIPKDNYGISAYARVKDYHGYMKMLFAELVPELSEKFGVNFYGFADHSPVNEKLCAAYGGLGVIGINSLLINEKYGSFVFIGVFLSPLKTENKAKEIISCINCGKCAEHCPGKAITANGITAEKCLSGLSQKKRLTEEEQQIVTYAGLCWGCDICQNVCPMNEKALFSPIDYFKDTYLDNVSTELIESMDDEEYSKYAFSWRKKEVILRNMHSADLKNKK